MTNSNVRVINRCPTELELYKYANRTAEKESPLYLAVYAHLQRCPRCQQLFHQYIERRIH